MLASLLSGTKRSLELYIKCQPSARKDAYIHSHLYKYAKLPPPLSSSIHLARWERDGCAFHITFITARAEIRHNSTRLLVYSEPTSPSRPKPAQASQTNRGILDRSRSPQRKKKERKKERKKKPIEARRADCESRGLSLDCFVVTGLPVLGLSSLVVGLVVGLVIGFLWPVYLV